MLVTVKVTWPVLSDGPTGGTESGTAGLGERDGMADHGGIETIPQGNGEGGRTRAIGRHPTRGDGHGRGAGIRRESRKTYGGGLGDGDSISDIGGGIGDTFDGGVGDGEGDLASAIGRPTGGTESGTAGLGERDGMAAHGGIETIAQGDGERGRTRAIGRHPTRGDGHRRGVRIHGRWVGMILHMK